MTTNDLHLLAEFAGYCAAHGIWSVSDGGPLTPFVATVTRNGDRKLTRYLAERLEVGVAKARKAFDRGRKKFERAVLVYDGFLTWDDRRTDALVVHAHSFRRRSSLEVAVPYREASSGFAVFRPKILAHAPEVEDPDLIGTHFFAVVDSHEKAAPVWSAHLDESM